MSLNLNSKKKPLLALIKQTEQIHLFSYPGVSCARLSKSSYSICKIGWDLDVDFLIKFEEEGSIDPKKDVFCKKCNEW